jgi:hypothetical protein
MCRNGRSARGLANLDYAIKIVLDVEQLIYEVNTFLNAASMMHRMKKQPHKISAQVQFCETKPISLSKYVSVLPLEPFLQVFAPCTK